MVGSHISPYFVLKTNGKYHLKNLDVGMILLKQTLKKQVVKLRAEFVWLKTGISGGPLYQGTEASSFVKCANFLDYISECKLVKNKPFATS
jgi:hypothetical protein